MRVRLDYSESDNAKGGSRFYLSYAGAAPTAGNCASIATSIAAAWSAHLAGLVNPDWQLTEIDVLDLASYSGFSGQWTGSEAGTASGGTSLVAAAANNVEFGIARRYRGGKPRMFLPPPTSNFQQDDGNYNDSFVGTTGTNVAAFFTAVEAISVGAVGALAHVNLSYYSGFTNITNSSGRTRAVPKYRAAALVDTVNGYFGKKVIGSQRRRRTATTY